MRAHLGPGLRIVIGVMAVVSAASPAAEAQVDVDRVLAQVFAEWKEGATAPPLGVLDRLAILGWDAAPALPRLIVALGGPDPASRASAARILMNLGPAARPAVPALTALVRDLDPNVRQAATQALSNLGKMAEPAIPALIEALRADPGPRRIELVWALSALGDPGQDVLIGLLSDPEPAVRREVVQRMAQFPWTNRFGRPTRIAKVIEPRLETLANDLDISVRTSLTHLIIVSRSESEAARASFRRLARDPDPGVRRAVAQSLSQTMTIPGPLLAEGLRLLEDKDPNVRSDAARYLPHQDLAAGVFIEALLRMLKDPSARVRAAAAQKLGQAHLTQQVWNRERRLERRTYTSVALARSANAFAALKSALSDTDPVVRGAAAGLLPIWKGEAATVIPLLTDRLKDPDANVRAQAASGLALFGPEVRGATRALLACLANPGAVEPAATAAAGASAQALEAIGGPARDKMIRMLLAQLNSLDQAVRNRARMAMQYLGKKTGGELMRRFSDPRTTRRVQIELMSILFGQIRQPPDPEMMAMAPVLRSLLREDEPNVRQIAIRLLTQLDPAAPEAVALYFAGLGEVEDAPQNNQNNQWFYSVINPEMIPRLLVGLGDENPEIRVETARSLSVLAWQLGQQGRQNRAGGSPSSPEQAADRERQRVLTVKLAHALIAALKDSDGRVRWIATFALGTLESEAQTVVPILVEMAKSAKERVPAGNMINLRQFNDRGQYYLLGPDQKDGDPLRIAAMQSLGAFGAAAAPAVPVLVEVLRDPDPRIRWFAIEALAVIGPAAKAAVPALIEALRSPDVAVAGGVRGNGGFFFNGMDEGPIRLIAAEALGRIGPEAKAAIPDLIAAMKGPDSRVRAEAARALGGIGPDAVPAIPELVRVLMRGRPGQATQWSQTSLAEIGAAAIPALLEVLRNNDPDARGAAMETLGMLKTKAAAELPQLIAGLNDPSPRVRAAAAQAVVEVGPESAAVIAALAAALKDQDDLVSSTVYNALAKLGKPAFPALLASTRDDDPAVRNAAVGLLTMMATPGTFRPDGSPFDSPHPSQAIRAALRSALGDRDERIRSGASEALKDVGEPVVPDLVAALDDPSPTIRSGAARTLGALANSAREALAPLHRHRDDPDAEARRAVEVAIHAIEEREHFEVQSIPMEH
jgi:HEAT repeat protein